MAPPLPLAPLVPGCGEYVNVKPEATPIADPPPPDDEPSSVPAAPGPWPWRPITAGYDIVAAAL